MPLIQVTDWRPTDNMLWRRKSLAAFGLAVLFVLAMVWAAGDESPRSANSGRVSVREGQDPSRTALQTAPAEEAGREPVEASHGSSDQGGTGDKVVQQPYVVFVSDSYGLALEATEVRMGFAQHGAAQSETIETSVTSKDGTALFLPEDGLLPYFISVSREGFAPRGLVGEDLERVRHGRTFEVRLGVASELRVNVVDGDGHSVEGQQVNIYFSAKSHDAVGSERRPPGVRGGNIYAFTNSAGVARFEGIEPGWWEALCYPWKDKAHSSRVPVDCTSAYCEVSLVVTPRWPSSGSCSGTVELGTEWDSVEHIVSGYHIQRQGRNGVDPIYDEGGVAAFYVPCEDGVLMTVCRRLPGGGPADVAERSQTIELQPGTHGFAWRPVWH